GLAPPGNTKSQGRGTEPPEKPPPNPAYPDTPTDPPAPAAPPYPHPPPPTHSPNSPPDPQHPETPPPSQRSPHPAAGFPGCHRHRAHHPAQRPARPETQPRPR